MHIQIIGTKKSSETRAAERFFKERGIPVQFVDLTQRGLSPGELNNITRSISPEELIDRQGKEYQNLGLQYMEFDILEKLSEKPLLMKMPVVRWGSKATVGHAPESWKAWIQQETK